MNAQGIVVPRNSPHFAKADNRWNLGEGVPYDTGGILGADNPLLIDARQPSASLTTDIQILRNWTPRIAGVDSLIGRLYDHANTAQAEVEASFEILAPSPLQTGPDKHIVVVLLASQTFVTRNAQNAEGDPHDYPGDPSFFGAWNDVGSLFPYGFRLIGDFKTGHPFQVIAAHIVPRTSEHPLVSYVQRVRQLRHIVFTMLTDPTWQMNCSAANITFLVGGGSFGGLVAQACPLLFPAEFHAGITSAFSAALRTVPNEQHSFAFMNAAMAAGAIRPTLPLNSMLDWSCLAAQYGADFLDLSMVHRIAWARSVGASQTYVQRPHYYVIGDEDEVTHGDDFLRLLAPGPNPWCVPYSGFIPLTSGSNTFDIYWSVKGKTCHTDGAGGDLFDIPTTTLSANDPYEAAKFMVTKTFQQEGKTATNAVPKRVGLPPGIATAEPHDAAFDRKVVRTLPSYAPDLLVPATEFRQYGIGTRLGLLESMKVAPAQSGANASVFTGSFDGVVARFEVESKSITWNGVSTPVRPLVEKARSRLTLNGDPVSLGYGAYALDVGNVDGGSDLEVVVATYARIAILSATDLVVKTSKDFANMGFPTARLWEYSSPRHVTIAELRSGNTNPEIVFHTPNGHLVVLDSALNVLADLYEPGIIDIAIGPSTAVIPGNLYTKPIYVLTGRGHIVAVEPDSTNDLHPNEMKLRAASALQYGICTDIDVVQVQGQPRIVGVFQARKGIGSFRVFDPQTLDLLDHFGSIEHLQVISPEGDELGAVDANALSGATLAVTNPGGNERWVTLVGDVIGVGWYGSYTPFEGVKDLGVSSPFAPARKPICVQAGNLDGVAGEEVVVATETGHLVWFALSELADPMTTLLPVTLRKVGPEVGGTTVYEDRTNTALSATWGMALDPRNTTNVPILRVSDASGSLWNVDGKTGAPSLVFDTLVGMRGVSYAGNGAQNLPIAGLNVNTPSYYWINKPVPSVPWLDLYARPYVLVDAPLDTWGIRNGYSIPPPAPPLPDVAFMLDGFWLAQFGSDAVSYSVGGTSTVRASWWAGTSVPDYPNLVTAFDYALGTVPAVIGIHNSTAPQALPGNQRPSKDRTSSEYMALRTESRSSAIFDQQNVRVGWVIPGQATPQSVVSTGGGRVILLDPSTNKWLCESPDLGHGGFALALANLDGESGDEILFAPIAAPIDTQGNRMSSRLFVLKYRSGPARLDVLGDYALTDAQAPDLAGYGACGIAVGQVEQGTPDLEVVVTSMTGELSVFRATPGAPPTLTPLYRRFFPGSLGAISGIAISSAAGVNSGLPVVYLAGSGGLLRMDSVR